MPKKDLKKDVTIRDEKDLISKGNVATVNKEIEPPHPLKSLGDDVWGINIAGAGVLVMGAGFIPMVHLKQCADGKHWEIIR